MFLLPESFVRSIADSGYSSAQNLSLTFLDDMLWNQNASLLVERVIDVAKDLHNEERNPFEACWSNNLYWNLRADINLVRSDLPHPSSLNPLDLWDRPPAPLTRRSLQEEQPPHRGQELLRVRKRHQMGLARAMSGDKGDHFRKYCKSFYIR